MSEREEQIALFRWVAKMLQVGMYPELRLLFHIANERRCTPAQGAMLKKMGVRKGVPDLCLPVPRRGYHGLYIEMKSIKGRPTKEQKEWMRELIRQGYDASICYGAKEAIEKIIWYVNGES